MPAEPARKYRPVHHLEPRTPHDRLARLGVTMEEMNQNPLLVRFAKNASSVALATAVNRMRQRLH
ncbi:MAG: hypothetical protein AABW72_05075 [archaeon]